MEYKVRKSFFRFQMNSISNRKTKNKKCYRLKRTGSSPHKRSSIGRARLIKLSSK